MAAAAAAAAKSLQSCLTPCDPIDSSPPGFPFLGFSRQEHWSGLPFPSPVHESGKWKWSLPVMSDSLQLHGLKPTRLLHPWDFLGKSTGVGCHCLLRYAGQEATIRTGHGTTDWFQIGKGVCQCCILLPCLFNFYAEYIMRNAGLEEAQTGIKIAGRNTNNLRYADDTTLMAESE